MHRIRSFEEANMQAIDKSKPVMVTGGSGYIAGWIVKYLLEEGVTVRATVRDTGLPEKVAHLNRLAESLPGKLRLFAADLLNPGAFEQAMQGCELVMHTASPFLLKGGKDPRSTFIRPALEGTRNVLAAVNAVSTVKRVVLTSSAAAIYGDLADGDAFTEEHWNTTSSETHQPYNYSKAIAEKEAWKINRSQDRWDLITINPTMVFGPALTKTTASGSVALMKQFGDGTARFGVPDFAMGMVDVRDVARAHIQAGFTPEASGRHILSAGEFQLLEIGRILREHFGDRYPFPKKTAPKFLVYLLAPLLGTTRAFVKKNVGYRARFDNTYSIKDLNLTYRPLKETVIDHFQQLIDDGLVPKK